MRLEDLADVVPLNGNPIPPRVMESAQTQKFRTVLRESAKQGPNFAGHFTLVRIGCGTGCSRIAVIDAVDGTVVFPHTLSYVHVADWWHEPIEPEFSVGSRLVIVYGRAGSEDAPCGVSYYQWEQREFRLVRFEPYDCGKQNEQ